MKLVYFLFTLYVVWAAQSTKHSLYGSKQLEEDHHFTYKRNSTIDFEDHFNKMMFNVNVEEYNCTDVTLPNGLSCKVIKDLDLCSYIPAQYCQLTCANCCSNVPNNDFCLQVKLYGYCETSTQKNQCMKTCGKCGQVLAYYALSVFKNVIKDPEQLSSWNGTGLCSSYVGVSCTDNEVSALNMYGIKSSFKTSIPKEFSLLYALTTLDLDNTGLSGTLPPQISTLSKLQNLWLYGNSISGSLPSEFSIWEDIQYFDINVNQIEGSLPREYSTWINIKYFVVENTQVSGFLPVEYSAWKNMQYFYLHNTLVSAYLPSEYSVWPISDFYIDSTHLFGTIPAQYSVFSDADYCDFCDGNDVCVLSNFSSYNIFSNCKTC